VRRPCVYVHIYVYTYLCTYIYIYIYTLVYLYIHTVWRPKCEGHALWVDCLWRAFAACVRNCNCHGMWHDSFICSILQHTAAHCNTLQHTATHSSELNASEEHLQRVSPTAPVTVCDMAHSYAAYCNTLQRTATLLWVDCTWKVFAARFFNCSCHGMWNDSFICNTLQHTSTHFNTLQHNATHCNTLQHAAELTASEEHLQFVSSTALVTVCDMTHSSATHCNTLQHTATHCNSLQYTALSWLHLKSICSSCFELRLSLQLAATLCDCNTLQHTATYCNMLQHTALSPLHLSLCVTHLYAAYCNTLQHTVTHCNTLQHTATHCNTLQHTATHCNTLLWFYCTSRAFTACVFDWSYDGMWRDVFIQSVMLCMNTSCAVCWIWASRVLCVAYKYICDIVYSHATHSTWRIHTEHDWLQHSAAHCNM